MLTFNLTFHQKTKIPPPPSTSIEYNFDSTLKPKKIISKTDYHELIIGIIIGGYDGEDISVEIIKDCLCNNIITVVDNNGNPQNVSLYPIPKVNEVFKDSKKCAEKIIEKASGNGKDVKWTGLNNIDHAQYGAADIVATFDKLGTVGISIKMDTGQLKNDSVNTLFETLGLVQLNDKYFVEKHIKSWNKMTEYWIQLIKKEIKNKTIHSKWDKVSQILEQHLKPTWKNYQQETISLASAHLLYKSVDGMYMPSKKKDTISLKYFCRKFYAKYSKDFIEWKEPLGGIRGQYFGKIFQDSFTENDKKIKLGLMNVFQRQLSMCNNMNTLYVAEKGKIFWFIPSKKEFKRKFGVQNFIGKYKVQKSGSGYEFIIYTYNKNNEPVGSIIIIIRFANGQMNGFPTTKSRYKIDDTINGWTSILGKISDYY